MSFATSGLKMIAMVVLIYIFGNAIWPPRRQSSEMQADYLADDVADRVNASLNAAMRELFEELDSNHDGVIEYSEFIGMTLNTWAAFRSLDLALKSRLQLPTFRSLRASIRTAIEQNFPDIPFPDELRILAQEVGWWQTVRLAGWWYLFFLFYIQCVLCMYENVTAFLGLRPFVYRDKTQKDVDGVPKIPKISCLLYDAPLDNWYEKSKVILMTVSGMAVLRLIQAIVFTTIGMLSVNIAMTIPSKLWKDFWLGWVVRFCIQALLFSLGYYRVGMEGKVCDKSEAKILVGNHMAVVEIIVMFGLSFPSFISAVENEAVPLFSGVVRACNAILVDRLDKDSKRKTMEEIKRRCGDPDAPQLMIFPEGTLNNQKALFTFKPGAFEPGMPVQPVIFKIPFSHFNPCWTGEATGGNEVGEVLWRCVSQFVNRLEVKVLPVYHPSEEEKKNKMLFAENVRRLMAANLEIGVSDCRYEDYVALYKRYSQIKRERRLEEGRRPQQRFWFPFYRPVKLDMDEVLSPYSDVDSASIASEDLGVETLPGVVPPPESY
eukprot:TRINITY_DN9977_c0_g1_i3.p1 TRINITY_DN9977_c0_g1~~TRINITY_DN9977_c0_g1_i3.p1  ORF type:complete len:547 (+),score=242.74 TRINITY_DN9977_c0_g1_i3:89-1729(+)